MRKSCERHLWLILAIRHFQPGPAKLRPSLTVRDFRPRAVEARKTLRLPCPTTGDRRRFLDAGGGLGEEEAMAEAG